MSLLHPQPIQCPYCWQVIDIMIDGTILQQTYVEDCQICCRPIIIQITVDGNQQISIDSKMENE